MEHRRLGRSGLRVPAFGFGTATFGGVGAFFEAWGATDERGAARIVDLCLDHGVSLFDTADVYSDGRSEEILGAAIRGRRDRLLLSTKIALPSGDGPNDFGSSRQHLLDGIDGCLRRLGVDHVDILHLHDQDYDTPVEETLATLDQLVRAGKVRYVGASNFAGWHLMKSLALADRHGFPRYAAHQAYYSLLNRDYEWELMPLALDQGLGTIVWSPLGWGRLTGRIRRDAPPSAGSRADAIPDTAPPYDDERLFRIVDTLVEIAGEVARTVPQVALNWLLGRPSVSSVLIGARTEAQLVENLGAAGWSLTADQYARLDVASAVPPAYPVWHHRRFPMLHESRQA